MTSSFEGQLAQELSLSEKKIAAALKLLEEGGTIPFIARYRKEATGSLDEVQLRQIKERADYLNELQKRRTTILESIEGQGKLTEELRRAIEGCLIKNELEDLYLPYKPKRRTKAAIAKEKGLEPLAQLITSQPLNGVPEIEAIRFVDSEKGIENASKALEGARHIIAEEISELSPVRTYIRETYQKEAVLRSTVRNEFKDQETKFKQYYDFFEPVCKVPSHRYLAIRRGEQEQVLSVQIEAEEESLLREVERLVGLNSRSPYATELSLAIKDSYRRLLAPSLESEIRIELKLRSDQEAVEIFAQNLRHLLLSAPLGGKAVIGIDPGLRTGCKCAAVSQTGKYLDSLTLFIATGEEGVKKATRDFLQFVKRFSPSAIAIGNGTGGREAETFIKGLLKRENLQITVVMVSEAGASVYSASDVAREEFPQLDLTLRGGISIARRLQDPLAELVKVEPKSLGVGQYQHDVHQTLLEEKLHDVVESCVNRVGVDLNTASPSLLSYVAGIGSSLSKKIVSFREENGRFYSRQQLMEVPGMGPRTFEQCAGFLRIREGSHPLDASAVHPERYSVVSKMAEDLQLSLQELISNRSMIETIDLRSYESISLGQETLQDILSELKKPGRDPRQSFEMPKFLEGVSKLEDLKIGMTIEGVVTNVTAFGAFVDIGVHQEGLVHISELSNQFVKDPHSVVKAGDRLTVRVLSIDLILKRISLSAKSSIPKYKENPKGVNRGPEKFTHNPFNCL